jgi:adenine-specific DNA-methyltransferase
MAKKTPNKNKLTVETLKHDEATRKNIPSAEHQSLMHDKEKTPIRVAYERRNRDLDPQLVWRGKDEQDWSDLVVHAPPLYIQEKVQPKVLIDDLIRAVKSGEFSVNSKTNHSSLSTNHLREAQIDLFADFNGLPNESAKTEFYQHDAHWANRMILGDSLQVMASLAEREGLRGKVQCFYFDPPYGIKFNSNFQWSTTDRDVKDGRADHITREPEQVKAFRDTWRDGIHSYLTYLRDRLTVARDLLTDSGSIFVQIGDENLHRVRALMDEVFGDENICGQIAFQKTGGFAPTLISSVYDYVLWYSKKKDSVKFRKPLKNKDQSLIDAGYKWLELEGGPWIRLNSKQLSGEEMIPHGRRFQSSILVSAGASEKGSRSYHFEGKSFMPASGNHWKTSLEGLNALKKANRLIAVKNTLAYVRYAEDFSVTELSNVWSDTVRSTFAAAKTYVVQTSEKVVQRCLLMTTDPGDLVLDPTCGSGTTAYVGEQWGRRWITVDTSRVALALSRARIMGARYPYYLLVDSQEGQLKESEITRTVPSSQPTRGDIRHGFVYDRVPHITLKSIANNAEIDVIWEKYQETLEPLKEKLNQALGKKWEEWEIPREAEDKWTATAKQHHAQWWEQRISRQKEIDASIAAKAEYEYLDVPPIQQTPD